MRAFAGKTAVHGAGSRVHRASVSNSSTAFTSCKGTTSPSLSFARPRLRSLAEALSQEKPHKAACEPPPEPERRAIQRYSE
jgi:hypothetical protein